MIRIAKPLMLRRLNTNRAVEYFLSNLQSHNFRIKSAGM